MPSALHQRLQCEVEELREKLQQEKLKEAELCGVLQVKRFQQRRNAGKQLSDRNLGIYGAGLCITFF